MTFNANDFAADLRKRAAKIKADRDAGKLRDFHGRLATPEQIASYKAKGHWG